MADLAKCDLIKPPPEELAKCRTNAEKTALIRQTIAAAKYNLRNSDQFMERFERLTLPDADVSPALKSVFGWMRNEQHKALAKQGDPWSIYYGGITIVDPTLDWFGNMVTRFMYVLETVEYVSANHEEILMCFVVRNSVFERVYDLKIHICFTGPGASGKSFIHKVLQRCSIDGTFEKVSIKTARGDATDVDKNGKVEFRDEAPPMYFDPKADTEEEKEKLSEGQVLIQMCVINEEGKREQQTTIARHQSVIMMNTNKPSQMIPEALRTRFFIRSIPLWQTRDGKDLVDHIMKEREDLSKPEDMQRKTEFEYQCKVIQMLSAIIQTMIYIEQMVPPDLSVCFVYFRKYKALLAKQGINVAPRDMMRLWRFAQSLVIMQAIHIVFFTRTLTWDVNRPFKLKDVLLCQNFMFGTEQIAVFTLTMMGDMFVQYVCYKPYALTYQTARSSTW